MIASLIWKFWVVLIGFSDRALALVSQGAMPVTDVEATSFVAIEIPVLGQMYLRWRKEITRSLDLRIAATLIRSLRNPQKITPVFLCYSGLLPMLDLKIHNYICILIS